MPKKELKDKVVTVRLPKSLYKLVERAAEKEDRSIGYMIRKAAKTYLEEARSKSRVKR